MAKRFSNLVWVLTGIITIITFIIMLPFIIISGLSNKK